MPYDWGRRVWRKDLRLFTLNLLCSKCIELLGQKDFSTWWWTWPASVTEQCQAKGLRADPPQHLSVCWAGSSSLLQSVQTQLLWPKEGIRSASSISLTVLDTSLMIKSTAISIHCLKSLWNACMISFLKGSLYACGKKDRKKQTESHYMWFDLNNTYIFASFVQRKVKTSIIHNIIEV